MSDPSTARMAEAPGTPVAPADLAAAEIYVESAGRPVAGGRWYVLLDGTVLYEPVSGMTRRAVISAETLRSRRTWIRVSAALGT